MTFQPPKPMLATAMTDPVRETAFDDRYTSADWVLEEKMDGHRVVIRVAEDVRAWSRPRADGIMRPRELQPHTLAAAEHLPPGVYDGELCVQGGKSSDVTRLGAYQLFVAFDVLDFRGRDVTKENYATRRGLLLDGLRAMLRTFPEQLGVTTVESLPPSWAEVEAIWARGGEGAILKHLTSTYQPGKRSPEWVKVKRVGAARLTVIGYEPGKFGPYSKVLLRGEDGIETSVKTLNNDWLRKLAADPERYLGRELVISFAERLPTGKYRHPMWDHFAKEG